MKARNCKPQTEKKQRTFGHRFNASQKDHHSLPGQRGPFTGGRPARGSLSIRRGSRRAGNQPSSCRWVADCEQPSGSGSGERGEGRRPWHFRQTAAAQWRSPYARGGGGWRPAQGSGEQGGGRQCFRGQPFRFGQRSRVRQRANRRRKKKRQAARNQNVKPQGTGSQQVADKPPQQSSSPSEPPKQQDKRSENRSPKQQDKRSKNRSPKQQDKRSRNRSPKQQDRRSENRSPKQQDRRSENRSAGGRVRKRRLRLTLQTVPSIDQLISEAVDKFLCLDYGPSTGDSLQQTAAAGEPHNQGTSSQPSTSGVTTKTSKSTRWDVPSKAATLSDPGSSGKPEESRVRKKASRWDTPSTTATLSTAGDNKKLEETESGQGVSCLKATSIIPAVNVDEATKEPEEINSINEKLQGFSGGVTCPNPQVDVEQPKEQLDTPTRLLPIAALYTSATFTPVEVVGTSKPALENPLCCEKSEQKSSGGDPHDKKLKFLDTFSKVLSTPEKRQTETGRETELRTGNDVNREVTVKPQVSLKTKEKKLYQPQFSSITEKRGQNQSDEFQKTESGVPLVTPKTVNGDQHCQTVTSSEIESGITDQPTGKERHVHRANVELEKPHQPETISERRIVKIKPRPARSVSESDQRKTASKSSTHRRLIKVKSCDKAFKPILSCSFSEDQESDSHVVCETENNSDGQDFPCSFAEGRRAKESVSAAEESDEPLSDTVIEPSVARDFDFSSLFPHSQAEDERCIDFLTRRCANVALSSRQTDRRPQYGQYDSESEEDEGYWMNDWQYEDYEDQWFEQQRGDHYGNEQDGVVDAYGSSYYSDDADQWEDMSDTADGYEYYNTEVESYYPSQADVFESDSEKTDLTVVAHASSSVSVSPDKSQKKETKAAKINLPFVKKAKKSSLTNFNERDKLKALFSVRKKGSLKLTAKAQSSDSGRITGAQHKKQRGDAGSSHDAPSVVEGISDLNSIKAICMSSREKQTCASGKLTAETRYTEQNLPVSVSMSGPTGYVRLVSKDSAQHEPFEPLRSGSTDFSLSDQKDPSLSKVQQKGSTQRERHASSDFSDVGEQSYQTDLVIDDDEILREIDSCLEIQTVHSKENSDKELPSNISINDSHTLTAAVTGLKVQDSRETHSPGIHSQQTALTPDKTQSVFNPSISVFIGTKSSEAIPVQLTESLKITPPSVGKLQKENDSHNSETISTAVSQCASVSKSMPSCVRLEQDPSGTTDLNIFMDITANSSHSAGTGRDGSSSSAAAGIGALQKNRSGVPGANTQVERYGLAETNAHNDEEFVTTSVSLVVPRNKKLEINFERMMSSGASLADKNIEIEVTAESDCCKGDVELAEDASGISESAAGTKEKSSSPVVTELSAAPSGPKSLTTTLLRTPSAEKLGVESHREQSNDSEQMDATNVSIPPSDSCLEDRNEDGNTNPEAGSQLQTVPSPSLEVETNDTEMTSTDHSPTSPPCLTHCSQSIRRPDSVSDASPPQLKPQTLFPAPAHLPVNGSTVKCHENSTEDIDLLTENSAEPMEIGDVASQDSLGSSDVSPVSNPSHVADCVSRVATNPVVSKTVETGGGGGGLADVPSEGNQFAGESSSTTGLFSAAGHNPVVMPAEVFRSPAAQGGTDLDPSFSDDDENKSPDSDVSDDSLGEEPEFLSSVFGGSSPLSTFSTNVPAQSGEGRGEESSRRQASCPSSTFSLDSLLRDTKKDEAEEQKTSAMQEQLRKELLSGQSWSQEENDNDEMDYDDFTDEQKLFLTKLKLDEQEIRDSAPGEGVLSDQCLGQLFTEAVSPAACGVRMETSPSCLQQLFHNYQPCTLMDILSSDIISLTYHALPCKAEIQRWLFFVMSIHSSTMEVKKCADQLQQVLQWQMGDQRQKYTWAPSLVDLFRVFVNWGADLNDLVFDTSAIDPQQLQEKLPLESSAVQEGAPATCGRNFESLLRMLVSWLQARPGYSTEELNQMLLMLCRLSLDPSLCKMYILTELQICLASILECYQPSEWNSVVPYLCRKLGRLSSHHHNQVYVAKLFSSVCPRSRYLQHRLAYLLLHSTLTSHHHLSDSHIHRFQLADLLALIPEFKHMLQNDNYHVASLVHLLDLSVGPAAHHVSQKKQLFQLLEAVRLIVSEIRDSMQRLDCTKVKDMLLHLCLKWDLAVKANNIKQRKIFSCFSNTAQVEIEQLEDHGPTSNDDDNTLDDSSTSFSDDDSGEDEEDAAAPDVKLPKRHRSEDADSDRKNHSSAKDCGDAGSGVALSESAVASDLCSDDRSGGLETLEVESIDDAHHGGEEDERGDSADVLGHGVFRAHGSAECVPSGDGHLDASTPRDTQTAGTAAVDRSSILTAAAAAEKGAVPDKDRDSTRVWDSKRASVLDLEPNSADVDSDDSLPEL